MQLCICMHISSECPLKQMHKKNDVFSKNDFILIKYLSYKLIFVIRFKTYKQIRPKKSQEMNDAAKEARALFFKAKR